MVLNLKIRTFLLVLLLVFIPLSSGFVEGFRESMDPIPSLLYKGGMRMQSRKLFSHDIVLDYDDAGANTKHKKPGNGKGR
ncbi:hypothetical protein L6164_030311 [Bauhinia variegata]|uniref:Uncharacterized protein n=1 Tax=Bauhinia variegata TaxID=167791 RepID=A0ACB9LBY4_BAUVA|nr:hypothetical protein L6164_030311 [Bauhinia variegata]